MPAAHERGVRARVETWAVWLLPLLLATLAAGGWSAWRWWTAPVPHGGCYLF